MRRFEFTLNRMLSYKEQAKTAERNKLAALNARRTEVEQKITEIFEQTARLSEELSEKTRSGISSDELSSYNFQIDNNRKYIEQLDRDLKNAKLSVEIQLKAVIAATQEVEGLLKLKEKQYEEFLHDEGQEQERIVSEFVSTKLIREQHDNESRKAL